MRGLGEEGVMEGVNNGNYTDSLMLGIMRRFEFEYRVYYSVFVIALCEQYLLPACSLQLSSENSILRVLTNVRSPSVPSRIVSCFALPCSACSPSLRPVLCCSPVSSPCLVTANAHLIIVHPLSSGTGTAPSKLTGTNSHHLILAVASFNVQ